MVLLHVKNSEENQFIASVLTSESVDVITQRLVQLHNDRARLLRLARAIEELAQFGPATPDGAMTSYYPGAESGAAQAGAADDDEQPERLHPVRLGTGPSEDMQTLLRRSATEARAVVAVAQVERRIALTEADLREAFDRFKGCIMIAYPEGLPEHDEVRVILDGAEVLDGTSEARNVHDPMSAAIWWGSKKLARDKALVDYIGRNEKQKLIVKIQRADQGQPVSESAISPEEQKNLMAYYYKKQQEDKAMAEDDDDSYVASEWANPRALKESFVGLKKGGLLG
eukprot:c4021_g1_i1.p1 GENE.c4021_g1_i1~~c4021_g1_i1.p1  ORF type:complete len:313 (-),score=65.45 c4021_g1_i1:757-1608(-)